MMEAFEAGVRLSIFMLGAGVGLVGAAAKGGVTDGHPAFRHRQRCSGSAAGHR